MILSLTWIATILAAVGAAHLALLLARSHADLPSKFLIGLPLLGTALHLLGMITLNRITIASITLPLALVGIEGVRRSGLPNLPSPDGWAEKSGLGLTVLTTLAALTMALAPPLFRDEVAYHLAAPIAWLSRGQVVPLPLMSHSFFPFGVESAHLPVLELGDRFLGGVAAHMTQVVAMVAGILALASWTRSWVLTAAIATIPALALSGGAVMLEWVLTGLAIVLFRESSSETPNYALMALLVGAGLLTKYSFPLVIVICLVPLIRRADRRGMLAMVSGAVIGSIFYVRNFLWTGNPFEPMFSGVGESIVRYRAHPEDGMSSIAGYAFDPRFLEEALGVTPWLILGLAALALLRRRSRTEGQPRTIYSITFLLTIVLLVSLMLVGPSARILVPVVALMMISVFGMMGNRLDYRGLVATASGFQCLLPLLFTIALQPWSVLAGSESVDEYVGRRRESHAVVTRVNPQIRQGDRVLVVGHAEPYWMEGVVSSGGNGDSERVERHLTSMDRSTDFSEYDMLVCASEGSCDDIASERMRLVAGDSLVRIYRSSSKP